MNNSAVAHTVRFIPGSVQDVGVGSRPFAFSNRLLMAPRAQDQREQVYTSRFILLVGKFWPATCPKPLFRFPLSGHEPLVNQPLSGC
jgi:hypothetical protein